MKQIRLLTLAFTALLFASACSDDDSVGMEVKAPSNVQVALTVSQDNTGTVTVTPSADGASSFQILFGDVEGETATEINAGSSTTHTYAEGTYTLTVTAVGPTGLTAQITQTVNISFAAPANLTVDISILESNPFEIEVTPSADNATMFEVYFGDAENEEPTSVNVGETGNHIYEAAGTYTVRVVAMGAGAATAEDSQEIEIVGAVDPMGLPITFDNLLVNYEFTTFNGASFAVVDNPDQSGENTEASRVGAITNSGNNYEGGSFTLSPAVDFSGSKVITMKFWSDVTVPVLMKFEGGVSGERQNEVTATHGGTGWETLTFNFGTDAVKSYIDGSQGVGEPFVPTGQYAVMTLFIDGPGTTAGTFYLDDIQQAVAQSLPQLPASFEAADVAYELLGFGGVDPAVVIANPDASGINTSAKVVQLTKTAGAETWAGATMQLAGPIDFSAGTSVKVKVWSPRAGTTILFKVENSADEGIAAEASNSTSVANAWEELTFDLTGLINLSNSYDKLALFPDFGVAGQGEDFYFDDVMLAASEVVLPELPVDFEAADIAYSWVGFGSVDFGEIPSGVIPNPDASGINTSGYVVQISKTAGAQVWGGSSMNLAGPIDFASGTTIKMKVWSPRVGTPILFKVEDSGNSNIFAEASSTTTVANTWEELSFDFIGSVNLANSYDKIAVFPDFGSIGAGEDFYFDDIVLAVSQSVLPELPVDFESTNTAYNWIGFGSVDFGAIPAGVISNPDASGINTSSNVLQITKTSGAQVWGGASMTLAGAVDFTSGTTINIKVWSPRAGTAILLKFEDADSVLDGNGNPSVIVEVQASTTVAGAWEELSFDLTTFEAFSTSNAYDRIALFPDFGASGAGETFYFDDITIQ